ncbi:Serine-threonine protein kinase 19 domain containing protein [Naviculisporaceae sp. PSN 640]
MSNNLRSVLGIPRVQKKKKPVTRKSSASGNGSTSTSYADSSTLSSPWTSSLPRTKPSAGGTNSPATKLQTQNEHTRRGFSELDDISQAQRYTLTRMFDPVPDRGSGMNSTKIANVLNTRKALPPVNSTAHIQSLLITEKEMAEAVRNGVIRRVILPERKSLSGKGGKITGDLVILVKDLEVMVRNYHGRAGELLTENTKEKFINWLRSNPSAQRLSMLDSDFTREELDALIRAGFLTAVNENLGRLTGVYARPEDRSSMLSLEVVSQAAAGSIAAVGGDNALHSAGGTGGARSGSGGSIVGGSATMGTFSVAVPGAGVFLKLVAAALERIEELLERAQDREMPADDLREKWDGGVAGDRSAAALAKKARGEFVGILPGRTKKWKEFHGLAFDWILQEAVGVGLVEVFETGSVGLGVRLLT